jgi:hypothetical protein
MTKTGNVAREIKFRAWDTHRSMMLYGIENGQDIGHPISFADILNDSRFVVMQFTGMRTLEGVEVYEGDILANEQWLMIGKIAWDQSYIYGWAFITPDGACETMYPLIDDDDPGPINPLVEQEQCTSECSLIDAKLIGNIYEWPQLLSDDYFKLLEQHKKHKK